MSATAERRRVGGLPLAGYPRVPRPATVPLLVLSTGEADREVLPQAAAASGARPVDATNSALARTLEDLRGCV